MSTNDPEQRPRELRIKTKASEWARQKLEAEAAERAAEDAGVRQVSLRIPAEDLALVGVIAKRFGVSRNRALCLFIASACGDVYAELPHEERKKVLDAVAEDLGQPVKPHWLRDPPWDPEIENYMSKEQAEAEKWKARFEP